jgi:hypothetical protein
MANNPPLYNQSVHLGHATVADSLGDRFQPRYIPEQTPLDVSPNFANPMYRPMPAADGQSYGTGLSQEDLKIQELKLLMNKYPKYHVNPDVIIQWAIHSSFNGDNTFLDDKLEQLRTIDSLATVNSELLTKKAWRCY